MTSQAKHVYAVKDTIVLMITALNVQPTLFITMIH